VRINNNITAVNSHRQLGINQRSLSVNTERLSSGMRVNRAADDAAGLAISEKMRTQIRGLNRASLNIQDGASLLQVGDGALQFMHDKMQRMRELAVQAANGTNQDLDRAAIQLEFAQLTSEINASVRETNFNGKPLFDGTMGSTRAWDFGVESYVYDPAIIEGSVSTTFPAGGMDLFPWTAGAAFGTANSLAIASMTTNPASIPSSGLFAVQVQTPADGPFNFVLDFAHLHANTPGTVTVSHIESAFQNMFNQAGFAGTSFNMIAAPGTPRFEINFPRHPENSAALDGIMGRPGSVTPSVTIGIGTPTMDVSAANAIRESINTGRTFSNNHSGVFPINPSLDIPLFETAAIAFWVNPLIPRDPTSAGSQPFGMAVNFHDRQVPINLVPGHFSSIESFVSAQRGAFAAAGLSLDIQDGQIMIETIDTGPHVQFGDPLFVTADPDLVDQLGLGASAMVEPSQRAEEDYLWIQSGANSGDGIGIEIPRICARSLGLAIWPFDRDRNPLPDFIDGVSIDNFVTSANAEAPEPPPFPRMYTLSVMSHENATAAIRALDNAINIISMERASIGAQHNRLDYARANVDNTAENLQAAESRIRDTDMALEMTHFVRGQILTQSSTAMLAQANALPQSMLQLLG